MTEYDARSAPARVGASNQGMSDLVCAFFGDPLARSASRPSASTIAQAREAIHDEAQALFALQSTLPTDPADRRTIRSNTFRDCGAELSRVRGRSCAPGQIPLRRQAGMHHANVQACILVQQRPLLQPFEQRGAIRRRQDVIKRVIAAQSRAAVGHRQQVQVVIAENDGGRIAHGADSAQYFERIGSAIDQIADEPERIAVGRRISRRRAARRVPCRIPARRRSHTAPSD